MLCHAIDCSFYGATETPRVVKGGGGNPTIYQSKIGDIRYLYKIQSYFTSQMHNINMYKYSRDISDMLLYKCTMVYLFKETKCQV
jgi:hypothetical protein